MVHDARQQNTAQTQNNGAEKQDDLAALRAEVALLKQAVVDNGPRRSISS
ncbi:hypothetical protein [Fodinicola feengrottensis]|nr:hypothetical protein [Fodinicola feengrottensis]